MNCRQLVASLAALVGVSCSAPRAWVALPVEQPSAAHPVAALPLEDRVQVDDRQVAAELTALPDDAALLARFAAEPIWSIPAADHIDAAELRLLRALPVEGFEQLSVPVYEPSSQRVIDRVVLLTKDGRLRYTQPLGQDAGPDAVHLRVDLLRFDGSPARLAADGTLSFGPHPANELAMPEYLEQLARRGVRLRVSMDGAAAGSADELAMRAQFRGLGVLRLDGFAGGDGLNGSAGRDGSAGAWGQDGSDGRWGSAGSSSFVANGSQGGNGTPGLDGGNANHGRNGEAGGDGGRGGAGGRGENAGAIDLQVQAVEGLFDDKPLMAIRATRNGEPVLWRLPGDGVAVRSVGGLTDHIFPAVLVVPWAEGMRLSALGGNGGNGAPGGSGGDGGAGGKGGDGGDGGEGGDGGSGAMGTKGMAGVDATRQAVGSDGGAGGKGGDGGNGAPGGKGGNAGNGGAGGAGGNGGRGGEAGAGGDGGNVTLRVFGPKAVLPMLKSVMAFALHGGQAGRPGTGGAAGKGGAAGIGGKGGAGGAGGAAGRGGAGGMGGAGGDGLQYTVQKPSQYYNPATQSYQTTMVNSYEYNPGGKMGPQGPRGNDGKPGISGPAGLGGNAGAAGLAGAQGLDGQPSRGGRAGTVAWSFQEAEPLPAEAPPSRDLKLPDLSALQALEALPPLPSQPSDAPVDREPEPSMPEQTAPAPAPAPEKSRPAAETVETKLPRDSEAPRAPQPAETAPTPPPVVEEAPPSQEPVPAPPTEPASPPEAVEPSPEPPPTKPSPEARPTPAPEATQPVPAPEAQPAEQTAADEPAPVAETSEVTPEPSPFPYAATAIPKGSSRGLPVQVVGESDSHWELEINGKVRSFPKDKVTVKRR